MPRSLAPGWASGAVLALTTEQLLGAARNLPNRFPPHTRLGLLERLAEPITAPSSLDPSSLTGAIALVDTLTAPTALALCRLGLAGAILTGDAPPSGRHALVAARAVGLPVAWAPGWHPTTPHVFLDTTHPIAQLSSTPPSVNPPQPLTLDLPLPRVLPVAMAHLAERPWLELATGQREERLLAAALLDSGAARGVGLLRLEFLHYAVPDLTADDLQELLTDLLTDLRHHPVAVRLTDWSDDKPPPKDGPLRHWKGSRGLDGIAGTSSLDVQLDTLLEAQARSGHRSLRIIAPHVERVEPLQQVSDRIGAAACVAMVESHLALEHITAYAPFVGGVWFGLGDLSRAYGNRPAAALRDTILTASEKLGDMERAVCGAPVTSPEAQPGWAKV